MKKYLPGLIWLVCSASAAVPHRYLFLDPGLIEESSGVSLRVNPPERREVVIRADRPWEKLMISFFLTVRDEGGKLRLWYICRDADNVPNVAYAESEDGITWRKPDLGLVDYHGSRANNLVGLHSLEGVVYRDPHGEGDERYIYVTSDSFNKKPAICRYTSPDGLHWRKDATPLLRCGSDTQDVTFWDERLQRYVLYFRGWKTSPRRRTVLRLDFASLKETSPIVPSGHGMGNYLNDEAPTVLACDAQDPVRTDIYNLSAQPYPVDPAWYVGFPTFLRRGEATAVPGYKGRDIGRGEVQFVGSSDGIAWHRYDRRPYLEPPLLAEEPRNLVYMGTGVIVRGGELWQYATEFRSKHGDVADRQRATDGSIARYVQRMDGFVSAESAGLGSRLRTRPVAVSGRRLLLNLNTAGLGSLRVGLVDAAGHFLPGFAPEDCEPVEADDLSAPVAWKGGADLTALQGQEVRLEFQEERCALYSFRFE